MFEDNKRDQFSLSSLRKISLKLFLNLSLSEKTGHQVNTLLGTMRDENFKNSSFR